MQKWKWRMLRISLIEPHSWVAKFRVAVFVNTMRLKRSQLEPFWSVSNNQFTNICSESIWRDPQHCQYIDYVNIPNIFSIFLVRVLRTPIHSIYCFFPLFWRMRHICDTSCLNFFFFSKYCKIADFDFTNYYVAQFIVGWRENIGLLQFRIECQKMLEMLPKTTFQRLNTKVFYVFETKTPLWVQFCIDTWKLLMLVISTFFDGKLICLGHQKHFLTKLSKGCYPRC